MGGEKCDSTNPWPQVLVGLAVREAQDKVAMERACGFLRLGLFTLNICKVAGIKGRQEARSRRKYVRSELSQGSQTRNSWTEVFSIRNEIH